MLPATVVNALLGSYTVPVMTLVAAAVSVNVPSAWMSPSTRPEISATKLPVVRSSEARWARMSPAAVLPTAMVTLKSPAWERMASPATPVRAPVEATLTVPPLVYRIRPMLPATVVNALLGLYTVPVMTLVAGAVSVKVPSAQMSPSTRPEISATRLPGVVVRSSPVATMPRPEVAPTRPPVPTVTVPPPAMRMPAPVPPRTTPSTVTLCCFAPLLTPAPET